MWNVVANIFWNIYSKWADRSVVRISVKYMKYEMIQNDPNSIVIMITTDPSRYFTKIALAHSGKTITIKRSKTYY